MVKLFDLGENGKVTLNKEWIAMIPEFQRILAMDKGGLFVIVDSFILLRGRLIYLYSLRK